MQNYSDYHEKLGNRTYSMKLASSVSDQNVYLTYVCLVNEVRQLAGNDNDMNSMNQDRPLHVGAYESMEDQSIQVGRSKALHELVETRKRNDSQLEHGIQRKPNTTKFEEDELTDKGEQDQYVNPNKLKLTKMKWLTEDREGCSDSSSPSLSSVGSSTSTCSTESIDKINNKLSFGEKCLSTILKLDREHNMFGMSNIAIVGKKVSKKIRKEDRPVFPQNAIIQICCVHGCCKHKSNTDLPASLKVKKNIFIFIYGKDTANERSGHLMVSDYRRPRPRATPEELQCGGCAPCVDPCHPVCIKPCDTPCDITPCPSKCSQCPTGRCICKSPCVKKCRVDCANAYGMKITYKKKPTFDPSPMELTPRSSCILQMPMAARLCTHTPHCLPPTSCFPYIMPCYWPSRAGAPCNHPTRCFHNPPCRPPRRRPTPIPPEEQCPTNEKCIDEKNDKKCLNETCPGNNPTMKSAIESRFGSKK